MFMKKQLAKVLSSPVIGRQKGISLIELVIFIVIVSVAMAGVISSINFNVRHSADPVVKKQALAIAESLLEEIELMPFTWCDPDDPIYSDPVALAILASPAGCTSGYAEVLGPETIAVVPETRYSPTTPFDNVSDYDGFTMSSGNIVDITNTNLGLNGYTASVAITEQAIGGIAAADSLHITVTVTGPLDTTVVLESYRTRYTPKESW
jgi:MSHA pilin protein MshD